MTDLEIARAVKPQPIEKIAKKLGLKKSEIEAYGTDKAKVTRAAPMQNNKQCGKLILVTAINPSPAGEGKTTVSIGLADGLARLKKNVCLALREPSLGPVFGIKGGATGGGYSQVIPMEDINLHFTGDFHAITAANNLLSALIDNHINQGNALKFDLNNIIHKRCIDLNDRALRSVEVGRGEKNGPARSDGFNITAASEVMAILALAENLADLKERLGNILIGLNTGGKPIYAREIQAQQAMAILLKDAIKPNLVQTLAGTPALVHCGPFANIAHGCNSIIASRIALSLADYVVTEAGFGADLGAEKFFNIKCRKSGLKPSAVVLVATIRALKLNGGMPLAELKTENVEAVKTGVVNLVRHIENLKKVFGIMPIVALNKFTTDTQAEFDIVNNVCARHGVAAIAADVWGKGGTGATELAHAVIDACNKPNNFKLAYEDELTPKQKIEIIAKNVYHAGSIKFSDKALADLKEIKRLKLNNLPVVIAKTQYSFSADKDLLGAPSGFEFFVREVTPKTGAGFLVVTAGNIMLMPGLSKEPAAIKMNIDENRVISGLF